MAEHRPLAVKEIMRILKPTGQAYLSLGSPPPLGFVNEAEWEKILEGFRVEQRGGFLQKWALFIRHPKGEGSWASSVIVDMIREDVLPFVHRYLEDREEHLRKHGLEKATPLFPSLGQETDGFYTINGFNQIKSQVEELSGVEFKLKDFRSTLTSMTISDDMSRLPAMSAQLRHTKIETTQKYYASIQQGVAGRQLKDAWKEHPVIPLPKSKEEAGAGSKVSKTPSIDRKEWMSGYA